jgi:hypothetical protein
VAGPLGPPLYHEFRISDFTFAMVFKRPLTTEELVSKLNYQLFLVMTIYFPKIANFEPAFPLSFCTFGFSEVETYHIESIE